MSKCGSKPSLIRPRSRFVQGRRGRIRWRARGPEIGGTRVHGDVRATRPCPCGRPARDGSWLADLGRRTRSKARVLPAGAQRRTPGRALGLGMVRPALIWRVAPRGGRVRRTTTTRFSAPRPAPTSVFLSSLGSWRGQGYSAEGGTAREVKLGHVKLAHG
jgi:hypothetical protein